MSHLLCDAHARRVHVLQLPVDKFTTEIRTVHRNDGSRCPTSTVTINGKTYKITASAFHA